MKKKILTCILLGTLTSCTHTAVKNESAGLCQKLPADLEFIHKTLRENSSNYNGSAEQRNISDLVFKKESQRPCSSDLDYARAIKSYLASYHDPHVTSIWTTPDAMHAAVIEFSTGRKPSAPPLKIEWVATGAYVQRYNDKYYVKNLDPSVLGKESTVQIGDQLKTCEGKTPEQILNQEIMPYLPVSAKQAAVYRFTPLIFFRWDQATNTSLHCVFDRKGTQIDATLNWRPVAEDYIQKTFQPVPKKIYEIEKTNYGHWIKLKSLGGYDKDSIAQLQLFADEGKTLQADKVIVMDLRGNTGGSSNWGTDWIDNLYGYHVRLDEQVKEFVWVSEGNIAHYDRFYQHLKASGGIESDYIKAAWNSINNALHHSPLGSFAEVKEPPAPKNKKHHSKFKGQVIVLTDYGVFSSAETFLEQLKFMPKVKQAGIASNASTYYSDIRFVITPAGLPINFPTKMDSGDPLGRKSGEALTPDWPLEYDAQAEFAGVDSLRRGLEKKLQ